MRPEEVEGERGRVLIVRDLIRNVIADAGYADEVLDANPVAARAWLRSAEEQVRKALAKLEDADRKGVYW